MYKITEAPSDAFKRITSRRKQIKLSFEEKQNSSISYLESNVR